jgi:polysaccharide export outer membrane protein
VNDIKVTGLTTEELQNVLTDKLKGYVNDPQVTITVRAIRSQKVFITGQVARPGVYPMSGRKTVLQLIAEAGGLATFAKSKSIYVLREQSGRQVRIPYSYKKILQGQGQVADVALLPGDMVVVP